LRTFRGVLEAIPGHPSPHRPQWLARFLGVNIVLTSRILKAAQQHDPLAVAHIIPGPEPLRRLLKAAERKKVDAAIIREARAAVDRFEHLIDVHAGDRSALDAIISGWLPDARAKVELIAKQSVFRGISQLLGTACDVEHSVIILYPSATHPGRADSVCATISRGLRRVRPGQPVKFDSIHSTAPMFTISGHPVTHGALHGLLLEQFCSKPMPPLQVVHLGDKAVYTLGGDGIGVQSAVSLAYATFLPGNKPMHRTAEEPAAVATVAVGIALPSKTLVFDVLVHEDVYPNQDPKLNIYRTAGVFTAGSGAERRLTGGVLGGAGSGREGDRIDVIEAVQPLGRGLARFRSVETPTVQEVIGYVCGQRRWDPEKLRGYCCRVEYPIYSSEIVLGFELPGPPGA